MNCCIYHLLLRWLGRGCVLMALFISMVVYAQAPANDEIVTDGRTQAAGMALSVEEVYAAIVRANRERLPKFFSTKLASAAIELQLKNIPAEMVEFGEKPQLHLYFKKDQRPRLVLTAVAAFYRNFFSPYEDTLIRSGLFLGVDGATHAQQFLKTFAVKLGTQQLEGLAITIRERAGLPGDYGIYYFSRDWLIKRVIFYEAEQAVVEIKYYYTKQGVYTLPKRMLIYLKGKNSLQLGKVETSSATPTAENDHIFINFSNYRFKPPANLNIGF